MGRIMNIVREIVEGVGVGKMGRGCSRANKRMVVITI